MIAPNVLPSRGAVPDRWYECLRLDATSADEPRDKPVLEEVHGLRVEKYIGAGETGLASDLNLALGLFARDRDLGKTYMQMEFELPVVGHRRKPDVAFVSYAAWPKGERIPSDAWWAVCPDLAVEIVSAYELTHATLAKVQEYFAAGVKAVWLVFPHVEQVYLYSAPAAVRILTRSDTLTGEPVLPGFALVLNDFFPAPAGA